MKKYKNVFVRSFYFMKDNQTLTLKRLKFFITGWCYLIKRHDIWQVSTLQVSRLQIYSIFKQQTYVSLNLRIDVDIFLHTGLCTVVRTCDRENIWANLGIIQRPTNFVHNMFANEWNPMSAVYKEYSKTRYRYPNTRRTNSKKVSDLWFLNYIKED